MQYVPHCEACGSVCIDAQYGVGNSKIYVTCLCGNCADLSLGFVWYCLMWFCEAENIQEGRNLGLA